MESSSPHTLSPQEDVGTILLGLGILNFQLPLMGMAKWGFKILHTLGGDNRVFSTGRMEGVPSPLAKNYSSLPLGKVSPVDYPHQIFIPPTKSSFPTNPLNSTFLLKTFFSEQYHDIKNALIHKVNYNLKLPLNSMKLTCFILS